jgi:hypothetical protein
MEKSNLFFTYLTKLKPQKEHQGKDENKKEELIFKSCDTSKADNEWLQEYELIYGSYSIDSI